MLTSLCTGRADGRSDPPSPCARAAAPDADEKEQAAAAWSDEVPIKTWAIGSGCATFYNTSASPNTSVTRFLESDRFEITATRDIQAGEELTHAYANLRLRTCYQGLGESWG